jgi:hypothetical protein
MGGFVETKVSLAIKEQLWFEYGGRLRRLFFALMLFVLACPCAWAVVVQTLSPDASTLYAARYLGLGFAFAIYDCPIASVTAASCFQHVWAGPTPELRQIRAMAVAADGQQLYVAETATWYNQNLEDQVVWLLVAFSSSLIFLNCHQYHCYNARTHTHVITRANTPHKTEQAIKVVHLVTGAVTYLEDGPGSRLIFDSVAAIQAVPGLPNEVASCRNALL